MDNLQKLDLSFFAHYNDINISQEKKVFDLDFPIGLKIEVTHFTSSEWVNITNKSLFYYETSSSKRSGNIYLSIFFSLENPKINLLCDNNPIMSSEESLEENTTPHYYFCKILYPESYLGCLVNPNYASSFTDSVLSFHLQNDFFKEFSTCNRISLLITSILDFEKINNSVLIKIQNNLNEILLFSINYCDSKQNYFVAPENECKFLSSPIEKEKILKARNIIMNNLHKMISLKELSKKVLLNECYLKKGFKEIFGCTVYNFFLKERMEYAKKLLLNQNLSVTDVSKILGYSSVSHFSTSFKKYCGIKACELLK